MKKRIRNIIAVLVALISLPVTGMTAAADDLPSWWGTTTWDAVEDMELLGEGTCVYPNAQLYLRNSAHEELDGFDFVMIVPRSKFIRFVLRDDLDPDTVRDAVAEAVAVYFPDLKPSDVYHGYEGEGFYLYQEQSALTSRYDTFDLEIVSKMPDNAVEIESGILLELARRHLISEYYGWGATARYDVGCFLGLSYEESYSVAGEATGEWIRVTPDWDGIQAYLDSHHPGCSVQGSRSIESAEPLTRREQVELACELWEVFDLPPRFCSEPEESQYTLGHNALENPGDVTLDTEIDIMDVIALNKQLLGAETLCDTAKKNADVGGDGTPDATDSLAILKYVVGLTTNLAET